jgi:hypothetical protein
MTFGRITFKIIIFNSKFKRIPFSIMTFGGTISIMTLMVAFNRTT